MKKLLRIHQSSGMHWVGNGFPVRSVFDYNGLGRELSPLLLARLRVVSIPSRHFEIAAEKDSEFLLFNLA